MKGGWFHQCNMGCPQTGAFSPLPPPVLPSPTDATELRQPESRGGAWAGHHSVDSNPVSLAAVGGEGTANP